MGGRKLSLMAVRPLASPAPQGQRHSLVVRAFLHSANQAPAKAAWDLLGD
jgi:hypothetical protein